MQPHFAPNDLQLFYRYLDRATNYFEFGSGGSTYQASIRAGIQSVHSVESDPGWFGKMSKTLAGNCKVRMTYVNMNTQPNTWGAPGPRSTLAQWLNYSNQILDEKENPDLILIDGRFRVACCLKSYDKVADNGYIIFDDFLDRPHYHVVLAYFDVIDKTVDKRMVVLRKKPGVVIPAELVRKYEKIQA